jgi:hypothetical protein
VCHADSCLSPLPSLSHISLQRPILPLHNFALSFSPLTPVFSFLVFLYLLLHRCCCCCRDAEAAIHRALENPDRLEHASPSSLASLNLARHHQQQQQQHQHHPSSRADRKDGNKGKSKKRRDEVPADMPREFLCQLCQRPMSEPVKSAYGHTFDMPVISKWFAQQGRVCPLTGEAAAIGYMCCDLMMSSIDFF